jgi:hypothetical protein
MRARERGAGRINIAEVAAAALPHLPALVERWLPGGRREGAEYVCAGLSGGAGRSCKVNMRTGRWADFATGEAGGDPVALAAAVARCGQLEAARRLAAMLGLDGGRQ